MTSGGNKTILIAENTEYEIENNYILKSPYIKSIKSKIGDNEELRIILPKWVTKNSLEYVIHYLKFEKVPETFDNNENLLQRILWISDFLHLETFQQIFIKEIIIPALNNKNCLMFLTESFKKLKTSEESSDSWYVLFNNSMNVTSKNLPWNFFNKKAELLQINEKILEEIIERSLKYNKNLFNTDQKSVVELLFHSRKKTDIFDLLESQRIVVRTKKQVLGPNQPNITWKLSNVSRITEKETNPFKFGGFSWKLVAKSVKNTSGLNELFFFLKFDSPVDPSSGTESQKEDILKSQGVGTSKSPRMDTPSANSSQGILTIFFVLKVNGQPYHQEVQIRSLNIEKNPLIQLCIFDNSEIAKMTGKDNEFIVHLNIEYVYSAILTHISKNVENYFNNTKIGTLSRDDLCCILRNLPDSSFHQDLGVSFTIQWVLQQKEHQNLIEVLKATNWEYVSLATLVKLTSLEAFMRNPETKHIINNQIKKKLQLKEDSVKIPSQQSIADVPTIEQRSRLGKDLLDITKQDGARALSQESSFIAENTFTSPLSRGRVHNTFNPIDSQNQPRHLSLQKNLMKIENNLSSSFQMNTSLQSTLNKSGVENNAQFKLHHATTISTEYCQSPTKANNINNITTTSNNKAVDKSIDFSITKGMQSPMAGSLNNSIISKELLRDKYSPGPEKRESLSSSIYNREPLIGSSTLNSISNKSSQLISPSSHGQHLMQSPGSKFFSSMNPEGKTSLLSNNEKSIQLARSASPELRDQSRTQKENVFSKFESMKKKNELKAIGNLGSTKGIQMADIRRMYSQLDKSTHEKIVLAKKALATEKEVLNKQIFEAIELNRFIYS